MRLEANGNDSHEPAWVCALSQPMQLHAIPTSQTGCSENHAIDPVIPDDILI